MPSAAAKVEKVASSEASDAVKQIANILEKRMRNLEKRKMKLDNYRLDVKNGKELNEDQKNAVSKYDEVEGVLEYTKELIKLTNTIMVDNARQQKKLAKKEQLERQQHEIQRLQEAFIYCHILSCFQNEDVRSDFLNGENGAVLLTNEQIAELDQLYKLIGPGLPNEQADLANHFHALAENHIFLVEGKNKEIAGTTYKVLKELLQRIKDSGYFSRPSENLEDGGTSSDELPEDETTNDNSEIIKESPKSSDEGSIAQSACSDQFETGNENILPESIHEEVPAEVASTLQNGPLQEVLSSQGSFNFLQESQIDLDAPHMDPAVVAVHQMAPPPAVNFAVNPYPPSPPPEEVNKSIINGSDSCDMPVPQSQPPINQVPVMPAGIPRSVAPVLSSVQHSGQHDFDPSHPIPTQTFTNQSFAVMQNMIMPPTYVPVTMHHGPIPPHITPIAVVPGLSPPVTSAGAPVVPIHVSVAPVPVPTVQENNISNDLEPKILEIEESQQVIEESNVVVSDESTTNGVSNDKGNDGNGYNPNYRSGFRGRGRGRGSNGYFRGRSSYNGRGGYQNHYYQDRNGYNGNFRRGNNRGPRGNGNNRGRGNYRTQVSQQQQQTQQ